MRLAFHNPLLQDLFLTPERQILGKGINLFNFTKQDQLKLKIFRVYIVTTHGESWAKRSLLFFSPNETEFQNPFRLQTIFDQVEESNNFAFFLDIYIYIFPSLFSPGIPPAK